MPHCVPSDRVRCWASELCAAYADFGEHEEDIDIDIATVEEQGPFTQAPDEAGDHMVNPALSQCLWLLV